MTKTDLQKELLEKVKPGTKPSDIKKGVKKPTLKGDLPPSIVEKDQGYESDSSDKSIPTAPPLPNKNLLDQITSLKKQLQTYKDFKEADLKIKERYKQEIEQLKKVIGKSNILIADKEKVIKELQAKNKEQDKTISDLQNQVKDKESKGDPIEVKEPTYYLFTCDICEQNKRSKLHMGKVNGLGIDPLKE